MVVDLWSTEWCMESWVLVRGGNNVGTMIDRLDIPTPEEIWAELASLCQHKLNARLGWLSQKAGYLCFQLHYCASYYFDVSVFFFGILLRYWDVQAKYTWPGTFPYIFGLCQLRQITFGHGTVLLCQASAGPKNCWP